MSQKSSKLSISYGAAYALLGLLISNAGYLSYKYAKFYYGGTMLASFDCADDCDSVMMSPFALFYGIPVPFFGLVYFLSLTAVFLLVHNKVLHRLVLDFLLLDGVLTALYFLYVLYFRLHMTCKFCLASHLGLFAFVLLYLTCLRKNYNKLDM